MKRGLLTIGLLLSGMTMMAQEVFNFGFETPPSELNVGKLEYVNFLPGDSLSLVTTEAHTGTTALMLQNVNTSAGNNYQRALKFRNLPFDANTSYRVSFWVKAPNTYTLAGSTTSTATTIRTRLEVGTENHDVNLVGANNTSYDYNFTGFDPAKWVRKTAMFYYTSDDVQKAYYKKLNPDSADLPVNYFLNLNVFNPGTYYIDDVSMVKSTIKGITYNNDVIKVDFGYTINGDALRAGKDYETASLPTSCVTVTKDGVPVDVEAVEIQKNGFYIFLTSEYLDDSSQGKVKITFNNPGTLKYTDALRPGAWDLNSDQNVLNFTDEVAEYDMDLSASSTLYAAPFLKSITPENESFDLPLTATTFKAVYSKKVDCALAKAVLAGTAGSLNLQVAESGFSDTLTYSLPSDKAVINGDYVLTISGVTSENGTPAEAKTVLSYSYGPSAGGKTDTVFADAWYKHRTNGVIPTGWKFVSKETTREGGSSQGSGPRMFYFATTGNFGEGMYMRTNQPDTARFSYGTYADNRLHIKPGKHKLSFYAVGWKAVGENTLRVVLKDTLGNVVLDKPVAHPNSISASGASTVVSNATLNEFTVLIPSESDYIIEIQTIGNWVERIVGKFTMLSVPSTAALYKNMLSTALTQANAALLLADSTIYNCTAKTDLKAKIDFYSAVAYTAPSDYTKAAGIINQATTLLGAHKTNVDAYFTSVSNAAAKITSYTGTKFANLDAFPKLISIKEQYDKLDPVVVDEAVLKVASDSMNYYANLMTNWATTSIPALTFRINKAITLAQKLKVPVPAEELAAAQAALTDDDAVVEALNAKIKQYLYHNIAIDSLHLGNSLENAAYTDSIELTNFVKNPNFYTRYTSNLVDNGTFPGWVTSGLIDNNTGTQNTNAGINTVASATTPVVDTYGQSLNNKLDYFEQTVTGLPAGIYNVDVKMRKGDAKNNGLTRAEVIGTQYAYVIVGTDTMKIDPWITTYPELPSVLIGVKNIKVPDNGSFKIGFHIGTYPGFTPTITWGDPQIWLVGKNTDFVYTNVKTPAVPAGEIREVQYYTIQGMRISRPARGLYIVKTIYENGAVDVKKIFNRF